MKINLHCHTKYSDGHASCFEMAEAHQKQGFSAFVVTDHVYWWNLKQRKNVAISSYEEFQCQTAELKEISKKLNFPCIQGLELALYGEEVLVFGSKVTKNLFETIDGFSAKEEQKYGNTAAWRRKVVTRLLQILKKDRENSAIILCHPHLVDTPDWVLKPLYPLLDGYEFQNSRHYYFTDQTNQDKKNRSDRKIPPEFEGKKKFYNSDAHSLRSISASEGNVHANPIKTLEDLIKWVKTPEQEKIKINAYSGFGRK